MTEYIILGIISLFSGIETTRRFMFIKNYKLIKCVIPFVIGLILFMGIAYYDLKHYPINKELNAYSRLSCDQVATYLSQYENGEIELYDEVAQFAKQKYMDCNK